MSNFAEGLVQGFAGTADGLYKTLRTAEAIKTAKQNRDIRETTKAAQTAWDDEKARINADTSMSDYDRRQALNAARGDYYDKLGAKYEEYGRGTDYNNIINAAGNARKEGRAHMLDMDQRAAYQAHEQAYQVKQRQGMASRVEKARNGDANALAYMQDIADYAGVQFKSENGQFLWAPKGADNAQFVPMDMNRALEAYNAFTSFEDKIRQRLQSEALLNGDVSKVDKHLGEQADLEKTKAVTQGLKIANDKASSPYYEYTADANGRVTRAKIDPITKKRVEVVGEDYNQMGEFHHGNATGGLKTLGNTNENVQSALGSVPTSVRDSGRFSNVRAHYGKDKNGNQVPMVTFQDYKLDKNGKPVKDKDGKPVLEEKTMPEAAFIQAIKVNFGKKKAAKKAISETPTGND